MSTPPSSPGRHDFSNEINALLNQAFGNYQQKIHSLFAHQEFPLEVHILLEELGSQIAKLTTCVSQRSFQKLDLDSKRIEKKVDDVFRSIINPEQQDPYTNEQRRVNEAKIGILNYLQEVKAILASLDRLETQRFEALVESSVGRKCLKLLVSMRNENAIELLVHFLESTPYVERTHKAACQILIDLANSKNPQDGPIIDDILFRLSSLDEGSNHLFFLITQYPDCTLFKRAMIAFEDEPISPHFSQCLAWAIPNNFLVLYNFMMACQSDSLRGDFIPIIETLINHARDRESVQLQNALVIVASELSADLPICRVIERSLPDLDSPTKGGLSPTSRLQRLRELTLYQTFRRPWAEYKLDIRLATKVLMLRREQTLLQVLSGTQYPCPTKKPISTCMPHVNSLWLGSELGKVVFHPDITTRLDQEGVRLCTFHPIDEPIKNKMMVRCLAVENSPTIWVQDSCTLLEDGERTRIQVPQVICDMRFLDRERILTRREDRMGPCARSCANGIGGRSVGGRQLDIVDCALELYPLLDAIEIGLLHDEGGNSLVGTVPSGPYQNRPFLLISQDTIDTNLELLQEELQALGLVFEAGQWHQRAPYRTDHIPFEQEDLLQLLAADRNIDPRLIFPYPPADYHGDTFMCIGNRVVVINDSLAALKFEKTFFERESRRKKKASVIDYEQVHLPQARLRHEAEHLAFQQLQGPLKKLGIRVVMAPARFKRRDQDPGPTRKDEANFFNHISLVTPSGKELIIMPGCPKEYKHMAKDFVRKILKFKDAEIIFTSEKEMVDLYEREGAVRCTTKRSTMPL